jgi:hypothetical protein
MGAEVNTKPGDLGQSPGYERRPGVQSEAEPVGNAGGDGDHVLHRRAEFKTGNITAGIDAKKGCGKQLLRSAGCFLVR